MLASEHIKEIQKMIDTYGDFPVYYAVDGVHLEVNGISFEMAEESLINDIHLPDRFLID